MCIAKKCSYGVFSVHPKMTVCVLQLVGEGVLEFDENDDHGPTNKFVSVSGKCCTVINVVFL